VKYTVQMLSSARKALAALPKPDQIRVDQHITALADNPRLVGAIPLKGSGKGLWRLRVGNYRVLYSIEDDKRIVVVVDVGNRKDIYRRL
jgi:mRNA interferase RelE/StbE